LPPAVKRTNAGVDNVSFGQQSTKLRNMERKKQIVVINVKYSFRSSGTNRKIDIEFHLTRDISANP